MVSWAFNLFHPVLLCGSSPPFCSSLADVIHHFQLSGLSSAEAALIHHHRHQFPASGWRVACLQLTASLPLARDMMTSWQRPLACLVAGCGFGCNTPGLLDTSTRCDQLKEYLNSFSAATQIKTLLKLSTLLVLMNASLFWRKGWF